MARNRTPARRRTTTVLLTGCAMAALLTAVPRAASAQSFNGSPSIVAGDALITTAPGTTDVQVFLPETVINWKAVTGTGSTAIDFQPAGTTATFTGGANVGDYTVLNRILPVDGSGGPVAATVAFNGTVTSTLFGGAQGGNIWFYSPTGIIAGPTATFNVGSLILTTDDIQFVAGVPDISNGSIYGPGGLVQFRGVAGSAGLVDIQPGAKITADGTNSYVALVAPRVQQGGTVSANGPIGYIGAEQADMTINAGLFNISILAGTTDPNGVVHTGTTTGPASTSYFDQQQIMMVAMPKSTALTMLLSGSIGYTPAVSAYDDGSSIVLSSGFSAPVPSAETTDSLGRISIDNAAFSNPLTAYATGSISVTGNGGPVSFAPYTNLFAQDAVDITLAAGQSVTEAGALTVSAGRTGKGGTIDVKVGKDASLTADAYIDLNASSNVVPFTTPAFVNAEGGTITVDVDGGTISSTGLSGSAYGSANYDPVLGGTARGGSVAFTVRNGGTIGGGGYLSAVADAYAGSSDNVAGDAVAGTASLTSLGGVLSVGSVYLGAQAYGASGGTTSGAATGGKATVLLDGGNYNWNSFTLSTDSSGSSGGGQGGAVAGLADAIDISLINGAALVTGSIDLSSDAYGSFNPAAGSVVRGGGINLSMTGTSSLAFANLTATTQAGINESFYSGGPSSTPDTVGGTITLTADGSTLSGQSAALFADGFQLGALDNAGTAHGGTVAVNLLNGSSLTLTSGEGGSGLSLSASGFGALGDSAADAFGGSATLTISDSAVNVAGLIDVAALGKANDDAIFTPSGSNPTGFNATGGTATVTLASSSPGSASITAGNLIVDAGADASTPEFYSFGGETFPSGYYGGPFQADGGTGTGGTATLNLGGSVSVPLATVRANGSGGISAASYSGTAFRSGDGRGGTAAVTVSGGTNAIPALTVSAIGYGGNGSPTGDVGTVPALAGDGFGGNASLTSSGGTLQADSLAIDATGYGGAGGDGPDDSSLTPATDGGVGTGGTARLVSTAGGTGTLTLPAFTITAAGIGGRGGDAALGPDGNGGNGIGGTAATQLADGAFSLGPVLLNADGTGGDGSSGGEGSGGTAQFTLIDTSGPSGARTLGSLSLHASGVSGTSATGPVAATDAGSTGLDVEVGSSAAGLTVDGDFEALARGSRAAAGNGFTGKVTGTVFRINGNASIDTPRDVTITAPGVIFASGSFTSLSRSFTETGLISAYSSVAITAPQGISADQLRTDGGTTTLLATNGAITVANLTSYGDVTLSSSGGITLAGDLTAGGPLGVDTRGAFVANGSTISGDATVVADGGITMASLQSGAITRLTASAGNILIGNLATTGRISASGLGVDIASDGSLNFDQAQATSTDVRIRTGGDLTGLILTAQRDIELTAGGTFRLTGQAQGANITTTSGDIAIGATARLGARGTTGEITLLNGSPSQETFVGGASQTGAYSLDSGEIARLFADGGISISIAGSELSASQGHITVGDLALTFGSGSTANIGTGGFLEISTPTQMSIVGNVALTTSSADDRFIIDPVRVELNTDTGSIAMLDSSSNPLGQLNVRGDTVAVGTAATLNQLALLTDFAAINALLDQPGGKTGSLRAGTMSFNVADGLYIQNTGASTAADDRRGFAANGLSITTASPSTRISINGVILQGGNPVTGLATGPLVTINGSAPTVGGRYDPLSTINGCALGTYCATPPPPDEPEFIQPTDDDLEPPVTPDHPGDGVLSGTLVQLEDNEPLISPPLVDEPITGVGNDDLWQVHCDPQEEGCPQEDAAK